MSAYAQLLEAVILHVEQLAAQDVRHLPVTAATLAELSAKPGRRNPTPLPSAALAPAPLAPARPRAAPAPAPARPPAGEIFPDTAVPPTPIAAPMPGGPLPPKLAPAAKAEAFAALRERALACRQCEHLATTRRQVVFGTGDINARILFVGEAPGADEDLAGEPFVGRAGELLTKIITAMGLSRESVYIANILKCRPDLPPGAPGNRKPRPEEMATCSPWLQEQINLIQPEVLIALGATAVEGLLGGPVMITRQRGKWLTYRGIPLMPTYHPAYLLRNQVVSEKRRVWEDMLSVMERLKMPISPRQQGYFTTG